MKPKKFFCMILTLILFLCPICGQSTTPAARAASAVSPIEQAKKQQALLAKKIYEVNFGGGSYIPGIEDTDSIYCVYSLKQAGFSADTFYLAVSDRLTQQLQTLSDGGKLENLSNNQEFTLESYENNAYVIINYTKIALFLSLMGKDITNIGGLNLAEKITNPDLFSIANATTLSRESLILLTMKEAGVPWPTSAGTIQEADLVNNILADVEPQIEASKNWDSYDSAAMVIQALAPYTTKSVEGVDRASVAAARDTVLDLLSKVQNEDGAFISYGSSNAWSLAQVMITMGMFGIDPLTDPRFIKNGKTVFDASGTFVNVQNNTVDQDLVGGEYAYQPDQLLRGLTACIQVASGNHTTTPPPTTPNTSDTSKKQDTKITLKKPVIKKVTSPKKKTLKVSFRKVSGARKYTIQISTNKKFKKVKQKTVKSVKKVTFRKLKSKKTYYVRVRAIRGKIKSAYSKVKKKKVK